MAAMRDDHEISITADPRWQQVLDRDGGADGTFVYGVTSTGIYCRPSCPARKPGPERVRFFAVPQAAEQAGFRACKRCRPQNKTAADPRLDAVRRACRVIETAGTADGGLPTLARLGRETGLSSHHLQRLFKTLVGISPRQYGEALQVKRLKAGFKQGGAVAPALYDAGYGSSSRLYEKAPAHLGMTLASYARGGRGAEIAFATAASPLGRLLVAATEKGVCKVALGDNDGALERALGDDYPAAEIVRDGGRLKGPLGAVLGYVGKTAASGPAPGRPRHRLSVAGMGLPAGHPKGQTRYYKDIAAVLGKPGAARAVGRVCATNPVAVVIPCHRAVSTGGKLTGYRWGLGRKKKLLDGERGD